VFSNTKSKKGGRPVLFQMGNRPYRKKKLSPHFPLSKKTGSTKRVTGTSEKPLGGACLTNTEAKLWISSDNASAWMCQRISWVVVSVFWEGASWGGLINLTTVGFPAWSGQVVHLHPPPALNGELPRSMRYCPARRENFSWFGINRDRELPSNLFCIKFDSPPHFAYKALCLEAVP